MGRVVRLDDFGQVREPDIVVVAHWRPGTPVPGRLSAESPATPL
jgi:hypothetical protein